MKNKRNMSAVLFGLIPMITGFLLYKKLPNEMPIHWNISGNINQYGNKALVIIGFPLFMILISVIMMVISRFNHQNKKLNTILIWIFPVLSVILSTIIYTNALGYQINIISSVALIVGALLIVIGNYIPKTVPNKYVGFRTKKTLNNPEHWQKLNRLSGIWMVILGVIIFCAGVVGMYW
ncbi:DUF1648 domain-containing protein [Dellaglioa sp. BT-FLS60]